MLFTPKKYGREWTVVLAVCFIGASLVFAVIAVVASFARFEDLSDKILSVVGFLVGAVIWGALGRSLWKAAPESRR